MSNGTVVAFLVASFGLCATAFVAPGYGLPVENPPFELLLPNNAQQLEVTCNAALAGAHKGVRGVLARAKADFAYTVLAIEQIRSQLRRTTRVATVMSNVHPDASIRQAGRLCDARSREFLRGLYSDAELARRYAALSKMPLPAGYEERRILELELERFRRAGSHLPPPGREKLARLQRRIDALQTEYMAAISNSVETVTLKPAQLKGLSMSFIEQLERTPTGDILLPLRFVPYQTFISEAEDPTARRAVDTAYSNLGGRENLQRLEEVLKLRHEVAGLLGYPSWSAYVLPEGSVGSLSRLRTWLGNLRGRLLPAAQQNLKDLLVHKRKQEPGAERIESWDWRYYVAASQRDRQVDEQRLREYFPIDRLVPATQQFFGQLLGIEFVELNTKTWSTEVRAYALRDTATQEILGYAYFDLFLRPGKANLFAVDGLAASFQLPDGTRNKPAGVLLGNWLQAKNGQTLLSHKEVVTFVHEFGHLLEQTLHRTRYESLSLRRDFVEVPSETLENYAWEPTFLRAVSGHYRTGAPLPQEDLDRLITSRYINMPLEWARQLSFAEVDLAYHSEVLEDTTTLWNKYATEVFGVAPVPGTHPQSNFFYLMVGADSRLYAYLWSKMYAQDIFQYLKAKGLSNPEAGKALRRWIFEPRGTYEPDVLVRNLLGRPVSLDPLLTSLGLSKKAP